MQALDGSPEGTWRATIALARAPAGAPLYYGYRAFGPNWPHDAAWTPGTEHGFRADVDDDGNRFNPNKLLLDPYAREISHCVQTPAHPDRDGYRSGPASRTIDTGSFAPKGVVFAEADASGDTGMKPEHSFKDDIVYEVHLRGLTKSDPSVPAALRGTYAGAALRAPYLRDLGVTAVEFLPLHQTQNALNDDVDRKDAHNYWGYQTMGFFAPDRRHASDQTPGGATREFKAMVKAFHDAGLKVFLDVVYNHTEEAGGNGDTAQGCTIYTFRGLDNARYYETERGEGRPDAFANATGVGANFNAAEPIVRDLVLDSLAYWANEMGVDGFRFDLAAVLGNADRDGGFRFDRDDSDNILNRAVRELPVRPGEGGAGVDLVAEPYAVSMDAQEQGNFPRGWAEWNDRFRDTVRASQNKLGIVEVAPARLMTRVAGSQDMFGGNGRAPWASVNYVVVHDGFTLADLHGFDEKQNGLAWPYGPSDGGRSSADEMGWDHGGNVAAQHQAARTSLALLALSAGVPLITGGSEFHRTQRGNNNAYNLDTTA
ncbi:alpha-amylase family glycosyl hydrolase, partial [Jatrophihabitans endophyticus]|uniref:alpha-amylase family glycosyl hydrolase n=1 Tax=Jatrophihabitans endophyticus TaxID=1206085 RepID=UPI0019FB76DA